MGTTYNIMQTLEAAYKRLPFSAQTRMWHRQLLEKYAPWILSPAFSGNLTIYTLTFNESLLIQFMIDHYRSRFPNCHIVVYDNSSTDDTVEIAKRNHCEIRHYETHNTLNDLIHMQIKNTCWKDAKTDWVLVCDLDELLDINMHDLKEEDFSGKTIIKSECWHMINLENNYDVSSMKHGYRDADDQIYDKCLLFNKKYIKEINYEEGAHVCNPVGHVKLGKTYKMYHYKYINVEREVAKCRLTAERMSEINKKNNWGFQASHAEEKIRANFEAKRRTSVKVLP